MSQLHNPMSQLHKFKKRQGSHSISQYLDICVKPWQILCGCQEMHACNSSKPQGREDKRSMSS